MVSVICDWCGRTFYRCPASLKGKRHHFCSRECHNKFSSKRTNPKRYAEGMDFSKSAEVFRRIAVERNPTRMTPEVRTKLRASHLGRGQGITYTKTYGRHTHRVVAEQMLGRPLLPGEVVHHRDRDKTNNSPENLVVFKSQADHARHHSELRWFIRKLESIEEEEEKNAGTGETS